MTLERADCVTDNDRKTPVQRALEERSEFEMSLCDTVKVLRMESL